MDVILASASPRRKKLFSFLYDEFRVLPADIREIVPRSLPVEKCPEYLAYMKAESVANFGNNGSGILSADGRGNRGICHYQRAV